jgi:hypothetical protein
MRTSRDPHARPGRSASHLRRGVVLAAVMLAGGCMPPPFAELQSARLLRPGATEVTAHASRVTAYDEGESERAQDEFGLQVGYGLAERVELRGRYVRLSPATDQDGVNVVGLGPKVRLSEDVAALFLPVGFAFGGGVDAGDSFQFHPTLLLTLPASSRIEVNGSAKALIPLSGGADVLGALNVGLGLSTDLQRWAVRPEFGILFNPGESGHYKQFSVGLSFLTGP